MSEQQQEFSGRLFAAGSVTAIRAFRVDSLGRLCAPTNRYVFKPGVNDASCHLDRWWTGVERAIQSRPPLEKAKPNDKHRPGQLGCMCGFYAYHSAQHNPYHAADTVEAIVEATGVVTHGTKGIRAEKLRIVGIVEPSTSATGGVLFHQFSRWMGENNYDDIVGPASIVAGIASLVTSAVLAQMVSLWFLLGLVLAFTSVIVFVAACKAIDYAVGDTTGHVTRERIELVRRNYPDVVFYQSRTAAIKANPLTTPPKPVVPSPDDDDDFWTRSAS